MALGDDRYTHVAVIPFISLGLVYLKRHRIFASVAPGGPPAWVLAASGLLISYVASGPPAYVVEEYAPVLVGLAIAWCWIAGFFLFYGRNSTRAALFSLMLLALVIPIPPSMIQVAEVALQRGSADVAHAIFNFTSTPVFREGLIFALPGVTIEVARECSGIRSAIALLITALVLSHLFVRSNWRRAGCVLLALPIAVFKNAVRITTLSWLGSYVSVDYLYGDLHRRGGPVFSVLSLVLLLLVLWVARLGEDARDTQSARESSEPEQRPVSETTAP